MVAPGVPIFPTRMKRLWLLLAAAGLVATGGSTRAGQPEAQPAQAGDETPPGYTVRNISAGSSPIKLSGAVKIHLKGDGSTRQGKSNLNGIQLENCSQILVTRIKLTNWYQAIRANGSKGLEFRDVVCSLNRQQGWLLNNCSAVVLRHCTGEKTRVQHSFYAGNFGGGKSFNFLLEDSSFSNSALAEVQWNAESGSAAAQDITLRRVTIDNPSFALNLLSAQNVNLENCTVKSRKKSISADRAYGRSWVTQAVLKDGTTTQGRIYVGKGSTVKKQ